MRIHAQTLVLAWSALWLESSGSALAAVPGPGFKAVYSGLIYTENGVVPEHHGCFNLKVSNRHFSARMVVGSRQQSFSGYFDSYNAAYVRVREENDETCYYYFDEDYCTELDPGPVNWTISLQIISGGDEISGLVTYEREGWTASLLGARAGYSSKNPAPQAGTYTFVLPGSLDPQTGPAGHSYGTVTVDSSGKATLKAAMANRTKVIQSSPLAFNGAWPLYGSQTDHRGMLFGWLTFAEAPTNGPAGALQWILPAGRDTVFYPNGFDLQTSMAAAPYSQQATPLNANAIQLVFDTSTLAFTNNFALNSRGQFVNTSPNQATFQFTPRTGEFKGTVEIPGDGRKLNFSGTVLQDHNAGFGYFLTDGVAGSVVLVAGERNL